MPNHNCAPLPWKNPKTNNRDNRQRKQGVKPGLWSPVAVVNRLSTRRRIRDIIVLETPGTHLSTWLDQIQEKRLEQSNCSQSQRSAAAVPQLAQIMTTTTRHDQTKMGCANSPNFLMNAVANRVRQTVRVFRTLKIPN